MKRLRITLIAFLFVALSAFAVAQEPRDEPRPEPRPERQAPPPRESTPKQEPRRDEARPEKQEREEHAKPQHEEQRPEREQRGEVRHDEHARPAGQHARIPEDHFRARFGRSHTFVVNRTVIVEGRPRFQYSGYWFALVDPWPAEWLYTDDCYIDYVDGEYFLFNVLHPGVRVAVFVVE